MTSKSQQKLPKSGHFFDELLMNLKLILRLMGDHRVRFWLKLIPVLSILYLFFPDLLIGPFDDAALIWLSAKLFIELCPDEVVAEHIREISSLEEFAANPGIPDEQIVDAEFEEVED
jgi:hypothetical protein